MAGKHRVEVFSEIELDELLDAADYGPVLLETARGKYRLLRVPARGDDADTLAGYDSKALEAAFAEAFGSWPDADRAVLIERLNRTEEEQPRA